jgi:hypothetical protein
VVRETHPAAPDTEALGDANEYGVRDDSAARIAVFDGYPSLVHDPG